MSKLCFVACGAAIVFFSDFARQNGAFGQLAVPMAVGVKPQNKVARSSSEWGDTDCVFTGKLESVSAGPVASSSPPVYIHTLQFTVKKCLRGALKPGEKTECVSTARQLEKPVFPLGELCLVAIGESQGGLLVGRIEVASEKNVSDATFDCKVPASWKVEEGKLVSPWAELGEKAWPASAAGTGDVKCSKTGRPAFMAGRGVSLSVEPVSPKRSIEWTNPDGDGEYKITVTNSTDKSVSVPALLSDGKSPRWEESLVIRCDGRTYLCPGCHGVAGKVEPFVLLAGESVSTVVNILRLEGPRWPEGGSRLEFQFCLGEKTQTKSFYYMGRHHDPIRQSLAAPTGK
jgi:hypothetical protein